MHKACARGKSAIDQSGKKSRPHGRIILIPSFTPAYHLVNKSAHPKKAKTAAIERINFALLYRAGLEQRGAVGKNRRLKRSRNRCASMQNPGLVFICLYLSRTVKFKKSHLCGAANSAGHLSLAKEALTAAQNVSRNRAKPHRPQPTHR